MPGPALLAWAPDDSENRRQFAANCKRRDGDIWRLMDLS